MTNTRTTAIKSLITVAALSAALTGLGANAQPRPQNNHPLPPVAANASLDRQISDRITSLRTRIDEGRRFKKLSRSEGARLDTRINGVEALRIRYNRSHGLDRSEFATLNAKLDQLSKDIHYQGNDGNRH